MPVSSSERGDGLGRVLDPCGHIDLAQRAVLRVQIGADAKRRKAGSREPPRELRLQATEVSVLGTAGR